MTEITMKTLRLQLKKKWFEMTKDEIKKDFDCEKFEIID